MGSNKILKNTIAVYLKIIFNSIITLISTRIVLDCLGVSDFGLYNLLAGVIVLLSFMNGALSFSTQRYLSIAIGEKREDKLKSIFNVSIVIHAVLSVLILTVMLLIQPLIIDYVLNIPPSAITTAHIVYDIMIISSVITLLQVPYSAEMNAHEDIYYWAFTEALNCFLRFMSAVALLYIDSNKLEWYTILVLMSLVISALTKYIWCRSKYKETELLISEMKNKVLIKEMFGFVGWNTLGSSAYLVRNQGVAVLLNVFFGTVVNAAYGIANQVNGLVMTFAITITTVFAPKIIQAHGAGNDEKMLSTAILSSKLSFLISSVTAIPLIMFMPEILNLWLNVVPEYTVDFCRLILYVFIINQLTAGLNRVVYAIGKMKWFQIIYSSILVLIIPVGYILFKMNISVNTIFFVMMFAQVGIMLLEIIYVYIYYKFNIKKFFFQSIFSAVVLLIVFIEILNNLLNIINTTLRTSCIIAIIICICYIFVYLIGILNKGERGLIINYISKNKRK